MKIYAPTGIVSWTAVILGVLTLASSVSAVPTTVFFDGTTVGGENKGLSDPTSAQAAGVPVISPGLFETGGTLDVINQSADGMVLPSAPGMNFEVTSTWTVKNVSGFDITGDTYLFFATALNRTVTTSEGMFNTMYTQNELGLVIDESLGWVIAMANDASLGDFYYAGILLDSGNFMADEEVMIDIKHFLVNPEIFPDGGNLVLGLPKLNLLIGNVAVVVPEPGTAALMGLGLVALGYARRKNA